MIEFQEIGRLAAADDNCAIAIRRLAAETAVSTTATPLIDPFTLSHTILEGHRFAVRPIPTGTLLLSWGVPFGRAVTDIAPGDYVCNTAVLQALGSRQLDFKLPHSPNFADELASYKFDAAQFQPAPPLPLRNDSRTFMGIERPDNRGVGTRNMIVLLGVNALANGFAQQLAQVVKPLIAPFDGIDDVVAVMHTEGSQRGNNNEEMLLRTLAGFMVHPNVGAVLLLDAGNDGVTNEMVRQYAIMHNYPINDVLHGVASQKRPFAETLAQSVEIIKSWLPQVNGMVRTPQPISALKIALQCGGSDAFSGISGNPLAAWVGKAIIERGGAAVLAETDELIGAEAYVLQKVADVATVEQFLMMVAQFQERAEWHGHSAHGNPSGGNLFRGLYNIYLKSLGAATKRHPDVRLDGVLKYGERMDAPGYYFMDSPGNDLESIAGQVATGCNLIYFVTGNGSITNFPFVPTLKIVTTSERYALLPDEMDVNAGAYLDGVPLSQLGEETLDLSLAVATGQRTVGEKAGHAQVQIWRNWQLNGRIDLTQIAIQPQLDGQPIPIASPAEPIAATFDAWKTERGIVNGRIGLILPSSLCSGQIAHMAAQRLNQLGVGRDKQIARYVALAHTEGCGASTQAEFVDTLLGYLAHPLVATGLLLEHGCETTHNDFWRQRMLEVGLTPERFGWASVQMDGGIQQSLANIEAWFTADCDRMAAPQAVTAGLGHVWLGIMSDGSGGDEKTAVSLAHLTQQIVAAGGTVVLPANDPLLLNVAFTDQLQLRMRSQIRFDKETHPQRLARVPKSKVNNGQALSRNHAPTVAYAAPIKRQGFHIMATPTTQWVETMTGLGATGVSLIVTAVDEWKQPGHPFIPVVSASAGVEQIFAGETAVFFGATGLNFNQIGDVGFQITRGRLGVSL